MSKRNSVIAAIVIFVFVISSLASIYAASTFTSGQSASLVIGQAGFTTYGSATSQTGLHAPSGIVFDSSGDLWVADRLNNRTLEFVPPFTSGMLASLVIGQSSFISSAGTSVTQRSLGWPTGLAFDSSGDLWVADRLSNRILEFKPPFATGMSASLAIGQPDFTSSVGSSITTASSLYHPRAIAFDSSGNLWVADGGNDRILKFVPPFTTGMSASLVIGQSGFGSYGYSTSSTGLDTPFSIAFDRSGNLWASDEFNNRTLRYSAPFSSGMAASLVIGQPDFNSGGPATSQKGLSGPLGMVFDSSGNLWVNDQENSRTMMFSSPFSNGIPASLVLGQPSFTSATCSNYPTSSIMCYPSGLTFDSSGNLWVADQGDNRVLMFSESGAGSTTTSTSTTSPATTVTSTTTVTATEVSTTTSTMMSSITSTTTYVSTARTTITATTTFPVTSTSTSTTTVTTRSEATSLLPSIALPLAAAILVAGLLVFSWMRLRTRAH